MESNLVPRSGSFKRQTAVKVYLKELLSGTYVAQEGLEPNIIKTGRGSIARINIIATVVAREVLGDSVSFLLDDGTGRILARTFESQASVPEIAVSNVVLCIGRPRQYGTELYLVPEILRKVSMQWAEHRKRELGPIIPLAEQPEKERSVEELESSVAGRLVKMISTMDQGDGADVEAVIRESRLPHAEQLMERLLMRGDIFQIKPGRVKVLE